MRLSSELMTMMAVCVALSGCASSTKQSPRVELLESQLKIRSMQTRAFDTTNENMTLRAILATLQDFGFVIDKADEALGTITAKRIDKYPIRITVTVRKRRTTQVLVRMNAYYGQPVREPVIYQNFFTSLANSMFLTANPIQ
ncbi:MAG: hypothetical protein OXH06_07390 [Gemmatimonadetes bacterium]|nr:hypothetical protein [Gemmatimonadota bacterium]MDE3258685.1 hypothetical protein [Gemmatimonadota bacterium]